jgi:hypothetical protein
MVNIAENVSIGLHRKGKSGWAKHSLSAQASFAASMIEIWMKVLLEGTCTTVNVVDLKDPILRKVVLVLIDVFATGGPVISETFFLVVL